MILNSKSSQQRNFFPTLLNALKIYEPGDMDGPWSELNMLTRATAYPKIRPQIDTAITSTDTSQKSGSATCNASRCRSPPCFG